MPMSSGADDPRQHPVADEADGHSEGPDRADVDRDTGPEPAAGSRLAALRSTPSAQQAEFPFAIVEGRTVTELPKDLYIPPEALEVFLEAFEGPLDLLLYLIRRQNLDILDIRVAEITRQYMLYIELMQALQFELAAEYLVMAAMLAEIKSRMLLPRPELDDAQDEEDPRAELIRRLQEYERFKQAAEDLDALPRSDRDIFPGSAKAPPLDRQRPEPDLDLRELLVALSEVIQRASMFETHNVRLESLSTRERMGEVLRRVSESGTSESGTSASGDFVEFRSLFTAEEGRLGVIVTFIAIMELSRESLIEIVQNEPFAPIHVRARVQA